MTSATRTILLFGAVWTALCLFGFCAAARSQTASQPAAPTTLSAVAAATAQVSSPSVTLKWDPVTTMDDGTPIPANAAVSYNLYGGHAATGPWAAAINLLGTSTIRNGVALGPLCYYLTALVNGKESLPTMTQCLNVTATPSSVPSAPTNLVVTQN